MATATTTDPYDKIEKECGDPSYSQEFLGHHPLLNNSRPPKPLFPSTTELEEEEENPRFPQAHCPEGILMLSPDDSGPQPPIPTAPNPLPRVLEACTKTKTDSVDLLFQVAASKGIHFPPPRWWRPGGYENDGDE